MADVLDAPVFRVVISLIPSHLFLPPVYPFLYIGSLISLCQPFIVQHQNQKSH